MTAWRIVALVVLGAAAACADPSAAGGPDDADGAAPGGDADPDGDEDPDVVAPRPPPGDRLFAPGHVMEVAIELPAADWDVVRFQTRGYLHLYTPPCGTAPVPSPYTFAAAEVTVDGARVERAGVRKRGSIGSQDTVRPSLVLDLDAYEDGAEVDGLDKLVLTNSVYDASLIDQCMSYAMFAAAGLAAPRCGYAHVTVNGEDLGAYVHIESPRERFLADHFGDGTGDLYEGLHSDFRAGWEATFEPKTNEATADGAPLHAVTVALAASDADLLTALDRVIDLDEFLRYWAIEELVQHVDGYAGNTNNFLVYVDPADGRLRFVPWGTDADWQYYPQGPFATIGAIANRLYRHAEGRARLFATVAALADELWDEPVLLAEVDRLAALVAPALLPAQAAKVDAGLARVRGFITSRRTKLAAALAAPPQVEPLRSWTCLHAAGSFQIQLTAQYGSDGSGPYLNGPATIGGSYAGSGSYDASSFKSRFGVAGPGAGRGPNLSAVGQLADGVQYVYSLDLLNTRVAPGTTAPIDDATTFGRLYRVTPQRVWTLVGVLAGSVTISAGAATPGTSIGATLTGTTYWF